MLSFVNISQVIGVLHRSTDCLTQLHCVACCRLVTFDWRMLMECRSSC